MEKKIKKPFLYRIGIDDLSFLGRLKSLTLPLSSKGLFDSIHELAHYEFTAFIYSLYIVYKYIYRLYHSCLCYNTAKRNGSNEIR